MKKIISSLMALTTVSSIAGSVVSCSVRMSQIETSFSGGYKIEGYSDEENFNAFNGTSVTPYPTYATAAGTGGATTVTKVLSQQVLNLLGFNKSLMTKEVNVKQYRDTFVGMDKAVEDNSEDPIYGFTPSVDGIWIPNIKDSKKEMSQEEFYKAYDKTQISSLQGLYDLYNYVQSKGGDVPNVGLGSGALASYNTIDQALSDNNVAQDFFNSFLNLKGTIRDSAWTNIEFTPANAADAPKELDSKILSFNVAQTPLDPDKTGKDDKKIDTYQFEPIGDLTGLGANHDYDEINTAVNDIKQENPTVGNDEKSPYRLDLFALKDDISGASSPKFDTNAGLPTNKDDETYNASKNWGIRKAADIEGSGWSVLATDKEITKSKDDTEVIQKGLIKMNESVIAAAKPLQVTLTYSTNVRDKNAKKYDLTFNLNGLQAVFMATTQNTRYSDKDSEKDNNKKIGNTFFKWQFSHYQFTDVVDTITNPGREQSNEATKGFFSKLSIDNMSVAVHDNADDTK